MGGNEIWRFVGHVLGTTHVQRDESSDYRARCDPGRRQQQPAGKYFITNGGCTMLNLTGTAIGSILDLETADQTIDFAAQASDPSYASLATSYEIGGTSCGLADNGMGTLSQVVPNVVKRPNASAKINPLTNSLLQKIQENRHR